MLDLGDTFETDLQIEGKHIDAVEDSAKTLQDEMFPDTTIALLADWERRYNINPPAGASVVQRRNAVIAKMRATGGINKAYFYNIANGLGFNIESSTDPHLRIAEGEYNPFMADYGRADIDAVYDQDSGYSRFTWVAYGTNVESHDILQSIFKELKPEGTQVAFTNE